MIFIAGKFVFFFKQKTAYEMRISDWSSDVCSSDLEESRKCHRNGDADQMPGSHSCVFRAGLPLVAAQSRLHLMRYTATTANVIRVPVWRCNSHSLCPACRRVTFRLSCATRDSLHSRAPPLRPNVATIANRGPT